MWLASPLHNGHYACVADGDARVRRWAITAVQDNNDGPSPIATLRTYQYSSASDVYGEQGAALIAWWSQELAEHALIHPDHYDDVARLVIVEFASEPEPVFHWGLRGYEEGFGHPWGGSIDDVRRTLDRATCDIAGQVKSERGRTYGGHHPWDDPIIRS